MHNIVKRCVKYENIFSCSNGFAGFAFHDISPITSEYATSISWNISLPKTVFSKMAFEL